MKESSSQLKKERVADQKSDQSPVDWFETLFYQAPVAYFILDDSGTIVDLNEKCTTLLARKRTDLLQQPITAVLKDKSHASLLEHLKHAAASGKQQTIEMIVRLPDNRERTVLVETAALTTTARYQVALTDITSQKEMESEVRRWYTEEVILGQIIEIASSQDEVKVIIEQIAMLLAQFFEVKKSAFALLNQKQTVATVLAEYKELGEATSMGITIPVAGNPSLQHLLKTKQPLAILNVQTDPLMAPLHDVMRDLGVVSMLLVPILIQGRVVGTLGFDSPTKKAYSELDIKLCERVADHISHVLQRKRVHMQLKAQRDFARQVMETMGQGLMIIDAEQQINYVNPAACQLLGYDEAEILGQPWQTFLHESSETGRQLAEPKSWGRNNKVSIELVLAHKSGAAVYVMLTAVLEVRQGAFHHATAVLTNLTERKKIEEAQRLARDRALEASQLKSEFLANMSHEIRTPLNGIIGMTDLILGTSLNSEQREFAATIKKSSDVLLHLINDILDLSKIEAGKLTLESRDFDTRQCVEEALDLVVSRAGEKGLELAYIVNETVPPSLVGDVTRLRQVLVNLLGNAIKFTASGEVIVTVISEQLSDETHRVHFAVTDTGVGIPPERMDRLFKSFSQVDASTTRKYGGTGLGLAISRRLVEMMGGEIWVESELGQGSTFHFTITAVIGHAPHRVVYLSRQQKLVGKRALIVDDNHTNRQILQRQLARWGMASVLVANAQEALAQLAHDTVDVAILDMQMPEIDGATLAEMIGDLPAHQELPLLLLSSIGVRLPDPQSNLFVSVLSKPVKPSVLLQSLKKALATQDMPQTAELPAAAPETAQLPGTKHPMRILLAEDNAINQKVALRMLERIGYEADVAANGLEAIEALSRRSYDVILMDVQMPEMDGEEATRHIISEWPPAERPYIIAMTANALRGDEERYLAAGMDDYLSKPVRLADLTAVLQRVTTIS